MVELALRQELFLGKYAKVKLCVFGGTGKTGSNVIRVAKSKGYDIVALARRPESLREMFPEIQVIPGDVFKPDTIRTALAESDIVISTLGPVGRARETTIFSEGVVNIAKAMEELGKATSDRDCFIARNRSTS